MIIQEQNGKKVYSDGQQIESEMLAIAKKYPGEKVHEYVGGQYGYTINNTFSAVRENILNWYPFEKDATVLEVGAGMGALTGLLCRSCGRVVSVEMNEQRAAVIRERYKNADNLQIITTDINEISLNEKFDYVIFVGVLEYAGLFSTSNKPFQEFLSKTASFLKENGKLLFAIENQYGLKYWCGASEDHLQQPFKGINGYKERNTARTFSKQALVEMLDEIGLQQKRFYYVYPDYKFPTFIYTDEWKPEASDFQNIAFTYGKNSLLTANEKNIYEDLAKNNVLDFFANSFLVEASAVQLIEKHPILITSRSEVRPEYRVNTIIDTERRLTKKAVYPQALPHLKNVWENEQKLLNRKVPILCSEYADGCLTRTIFNGKKADTVLKEMLNADDKDGVLALIKDLQNAILKSSDLYDGKENYLTRHGLASPEMDLGPILKEGFIDLTFYNAFVADGSLTFFDQEWNFPEMPMEFIFYYAIKSLFERNNIQSSISLEFLCQYFGITKSKRDIFERTEEYVWSQILFRQGDLYGDGGYNVQYHNAEKIEDFQQIKNESVQLKQNLQEQIVQIQELKCQIEEKNSYINQVNSEISQKDTEVQQLHSEISQKDTEVQQLHSEISQKNTKVQQLHSEISQKNTEVQQLQQEISNKTGWIEELLQSDRELNGIKNSRTWRFMCCFWKFRDVVLPKKSKRRMLIKIFVKFCKHPVRFLKKCTPKRIYKFLRFFQKGDMREVSRRLDDCLRGNEIQSAPLDLLKAPSMSANSHKKEVSDYPVLQLPRWEKPLVSIVIPVYNEFEYTYLCVQSILKNTDQISYEIIIGDDCSSDLTQQIEQILPGIRVVRNKQNLRFLKNCNHAASFAKGDYILFLNNDTQVQANWLNSLIELIEQDSKIGMVGSKLVYPDGKLQEAGGILWSDGSAWNYGHAMNSSLPEYNYVKEVDYISGASIMIRHTLWNEIGGFDEEFAPAYCEDSDLAFQVREHGYKVMYQPRSVVVHFEGVSNGTDITCGQKAYQEINQKKFFKKWEKVLKENHYPHAEHVFRAREHGKGAKYLLMVDHYVPEIDKDAGSRTVYQYLKLFVNQGYRVKFIGDNFFPRQPYTQMLQEMGIEVLYGPYYAQNWKNWVEDNRDEIQYVFLNRPHISEKYIDFLRETTSAKIVYYGHDLHFLREERQFKITQDEALIKSSEQWKKRELSLMRKADMTYYPSHVEIELLQKIAPDVKAKAIPAYLFTDVKDRVFNAENRKDIMFVGGFVHQPNVDAVEWLAAEIMPRLSELMPDVVVHIFGSNPPQNILDLETSNLKIEGFVSDEDLEQAYNTCRLTLVPLRYGAGIKGKVVEAMNYGMPIVTTSVGAEGLDEVQDVMSIVDDANGFAEKIVEMYNDYDALQKQCTASTAYIRKHFSPENAKQVIAEDFDMSKEEE